MRLGAAVRVRGSWRSKHSVDETHEATPEAAKDRQTKLNQPEFAVREITILGDSDPGVRISKPPPRFPSSLVLIC
jgi:hypothetical protein